MAGNEVHLFTQKPAHVIWANAFDGIVASEAKKLSRKDKLSLIALPILLGMATAAVCTATLPVIVPVGLALGTIASSAYSIYRFYQSRSTRPERALKAMISGDYEKACTLFQCMLKPQFASMTEAGLRAHNADRAAKKMPLESRPDMFLSKYKTSFNFPNIRNNNCYSWELYGELYGSSILFKLCQEMGQKKLKTEDVNHQLDQARFWICESAKQTPPWQTELIQSLAKASKEGLQPPQNPIAPSLEKSNAVALLWAIERFDKCPLSGWLDNQHTVKYLQTLKINRASVGEAGYHLWLKLKECKKIEEMKIAANAFPQKEIDSLEARVLKK